MPNRDLAVRSWIQTPQKAAALQVCLRMELAGLEPATSWVRSRRRFGTKCADLLGVYQLSSTLTAQNSEPVCGGFAGAWSAQARAWTSGEVAITSRLAAPRGRSSEGVSTRR